jgi:3,4-dihydroxy 2-butanone 4-phosphate synthase
MLSAPTSASQGALEPPPTAFTGGRAAVLLDDHGAVLAFPAETATASQLHFAIRHGSGLIHAAMRSSRLDELQVPDQWIPSSQTSRSDFTVAVDAAAGITTGISAHDRARTLRVLGSTTSVPEDLIRPGHVLPIRCADGGFAERPRVWERAVDLVAAAGFSPVAVVCRLIGDDGDTLTEDAAFEFAQSSSLVVCELARSAATRRHLHVAGGARA